MKCKLIEVPNVLQVTSYNVHYFISHHVPALVVLNVIRALDNRPTIHTVGHLSKRNSTPKNICIESRYSSPLR